MALPNVTAKVTDLSSAKAPALDGLFGLIIPTLMGPDDKPYLIQSVDQFRDKFGVYSATLNPHFVAIRRALERGVNFMIQRLVATAAAAATYTGWTATQKLTVTAKSKGTWANNTLGLLWTNSTTQTLQVVYGPNTSIQETYTGATVDDIITAVNATSTLITISTTSGYAAPTTNATPVYLTAGSDGSFADNAAKDTAINALWPRFNDVLGLSGIAAPGVFTTACLTNLITYAESRQDLQAMFEVDPNIDSAAAITFAQSVVANKSAYLAMYYSSYQTVYSQDAKTTVQIGCLLDVMGVWAYTETLPDLYKAPAGAKRGLIPGVQSYAYNMLSPARKTSADTLNDLGVNIVGQHAAFGPVVWGAKTHNLSGTGSVLDNIHVVQMVIDMKLSWGAVYQTTLFDPMDPTYWRLAWTKIKPILKALEANKVIYPGWTYIGDQDASRIEDSRYNRLADLQVGKYRTKTQIVPVGYIEQIEFTLQTDGLSTLFNLGISTTGK